jgi:hypothetical protein
MGIEEARCEHEHDGQTQKPHRDPKLEILHTYDVLSILGSACLRVWDLLMPPSRQQPVGASLWSASAGSAIAYVAQPCGSWERVARSSLCNAPICCSVITVSA